MRHPVQLALLGILLGPLPLSAQAGSPAGPVPVANLAAPSVGIWCDARCAVELVAPCQLPFRRVAAGIEVLIILKLDLDISAAVLAIVPEVQSSRITPILAERELTAKDVAALTALPGRLQSMFVGALFW